LADSDHAAEIEIEAIDLNVKIPVSWFGAEKDVAHPLKYRVVRAIKGSFPDKGINALGGNSSCAIPWVKGKYYVSLYKSESMITYCNLRSVAETSEREKLDAEAPK
jgi:hypothetical protein